MEKTADMPSIEAEKAKSQFVTNSVLYKEFLAEREEILKHKWIESEKAGKDIGFEKALLDWIVKHRSNWRAKRLKEARTEKAAS
jgi:hypothetical protein